jgi:purine-binding chemotaxis protein CheW
MTNELTELRGNRTTTDPTERQLVVFALGDESFGVDIESVREIIRWQPVTHMPDTPESVLGVLNLRGRVIPIVDLRNRFGMASSEATDATRILVVDIGTDVGALVDSVEEVIRVSSDAIGELSPVVASSNSEYIDGIAQTEDRLLILLSMERALADGSASIGTTAAGAGSSEPAPLAERRDA